MSSRFLPPPQNQNSDAIMDRPYLRGTPGKLSPEKKRKFGLLLLRLRAKVKRETGKIPPYLSYQAIANKVGVCFFFNLKKNQFFRVCLFLCYSDFNLINILFDFLLFF